MTDLQRARFRLQEGGFTCVVCKGETEYSSTFRGVKPLASWLEGGMDFCGFSAADKVVGRATAFLYLLLRVSAVYAGVVSQSALSLLETHGVKVEYSTLVPHIVNRAGDGVCPFEKAVLSVDDASVARKIILTKMQELHITL